MVRCAPPTLLGEAASWPLQRGAGEGGGAAAGDYSILYYSRIYCTILYHTIPYHTILYYLYYRQRAAPAGRAQVNVPERDPARGGGGGGSEGVRDFKETVYPFFESDTLIPECLFVLCLVVQRFFESRDV